MIREVHEISENAMRELLYQLRHPDVKDVMRVRKMMDEIQKSMTVEKSEDGQDIVEFPDLDLSFLDADKTGYMKAKHSVVHCFSFSGEASLGHEVREHQYNYFAPNAA